jgi:Protein of unknown function (DUF3617)
MKTLWRLGLLSVLLLSGPAWAQKLAAGLWENTSTMKDSSPEGATRMAKMQEQMAKMPAEQRKMMEQMMARQGAGDAMGMMAGKPTTMRVCITPEQAARDYTPSHDARCKSDSVERSGKTMRAKFSCSGDDKATGETEYTLTSDKAFSGRVVVTSMRQGQPNRMEITQTGRWLAADCGEVKPLPVLPNSSPNSPPNSPPKQSAAKP